MVSRAFTRIALAAYQVASVTPFFTECSAATSLCLVPDVP
jgi:hypothetical protein